MLEARLVYNQRRPSLPQNHPTIIKPSFKSFSLFSWLNIKHSTLADGGLGRAAIRTRRNHQREIYICIIFCCFKRQIKFYLFLCSTGSVCDLKYEIFILMDWWRKSILLATHCEEGAGERKQFIRKVSLWFNKSPSPTANRKRYLHSFSFFIASLHSFSVSFSAAPVFAEPSEQDEDVNPLCEIIQLFFFCLCVAATSLHLCASSEKLLCANFSFISVCWFFGKSLLRLIMKCEDKEKSREIVRFEEGNWWKFFDIQFNEPGL